MPVRSILRSFAHRNFRLFFTGQGLSLIGTQIQIFALPLYVYLQYGKSEKLLGWVAFAGQFPAIFATPVAGVIADRVNKRRLLLVTQSLAMLQAALLAVLVFADWIQLWEIFALNIGLSLVNAFDITTRQAMLNEIVDSREDLGNAIALNSSIFNVTRLLGPALGSWFFLHLGAGTCFAVNAASFLAVLAALVAMRINRVPDPGQPKTALAGMRDGLRYTATSMPLRSILLLVTFVCFLAVPYNVLIPALAIKTFEGGAGLNGWMYSASGLGALTGALFLASRHSVMGMVRLIWVLPLVAGLAILGVSQTHSIPIALGLIFLIGLSIVMTLTTSNMLLQTITADSMRGRVLSLYALTFLGMAPLGGVVAGWLAESIGVQLTMQAGGLVLAFASLGFGLTLGNRLHGRVVRTFTKNVRATESNVDLENGPLPPPSQGKSESLLLKSVG
jgi:MFS family permease